MALSQAPARTATKRRKPDPQRVCETFWYEVKARGQWGAYTRTAAVHHCSDESVRRYIKQATQPAAPPLDADLQYQPAPGEKPIAPRELPQQQRRARPHYHTISHSRMMQASGILRQPVRSKRSNMGKVAQNQTATFHSAERETMRLDAGTLPQIAPPRTYPPRPTPARWDAQQLVDLALYQIGPVPLIAWLVFGLVVLLLMNR